MSQPSREATVQDHRERILRVLAHVQGHLDRDLSMEELARVAAFSEFHFHRIFREIVGEPVAEHVRRLRLERAALELYYTDKPVKQIAGDVGYASHEAFTHAFVSQFGASPAKYRARLAEPWGSTLDQVVYSAEERAGFEPFRLDERIRGIEIQDLQPQRVAYMRATGPYKTSLAARWVEFGTWLMERRGIDARAMKKFNMPLDNPDLTPPEKQRADVCIAVDATFAPEGDVGVQMLPSGNYAVARYRGPWTMAGLAWHWMFNVWVPRSGFAVRVAPAFEMFSSSVDTPMEDWELQIHLPVERS